MKTIEDTLKQIGKALAALSYPTIYQEDTKNLSGIYLTPEQVGVIRTTVETTSKGVFTTKVTPKSMHIGAGTQINVVQATDPNHALVRLDILGDSPYIKFEKCGIPTMHYDEDQKRWVCPICWWAEFTQVIFYQTEVDITSKPNGYLVEGGHDDNPSETSRDDVVCKGCKWHLDMPNEAKVVLKEDYVG